MTNHIALLDDGTTYDIIVEVVGDETSLEFCTLVDHYCEGDGLDIAMRAHGTRWKDIKPLVDEIEARAEAAATDGGRR